MPITNEVRRVDLPYLCPVEKFRGLVKGRTAAFLFGGGPSLKDFDVTPLREKFVVGCNDAYVHGDEIVDLLVFGDRSWWNKHKLLIRTKYKGPIGTTNGIGRSEKDLRWFGKVSRGISPSGGVGWNTNTGAMAINVALRLGVKYVILLGYDLHRDPVTNENNWHPNQISNPGARSYVTFRRGFKQVRESLWTHYPDAVVINANMESGLDLFPKMRREEALQRFL